jgi:cytochrome c-type biogenesis protein CcmH
MSGSDGPASGTRRRALGGFVLAAALAAVAVSLAVVALRGPAGPANLQERVRAVAEGLRCPVCQNLSVADSPSGLAHRMRATIARDLQAGRSPEDIRRGFVLAYGEWILLAPQRRGLNLVAWLAPAVLLMAGLATALWSTRRWAAVPTPSAGAPRTLSDADRRTLDRALAAPVEELE